MLGINLYSSESRVICTIKEAYGLVSQDRDGNSDTFVELLIAGKLFRTTTFWNSNHPIWEEAFDL
jgi:Ca2+-dependent lipid-binding protein